MITLKDRLTRVLVIVGIVLRLPEEEKFLKVNLPGYLDCCKKTRFHLIPFGW